MSQSYDGDSSKNSKAFRIISLLYRCNSSILVWKMESQGRFCWIMMMMIMSKLTSGRRLTRCNLRRSCITANVVDTVTEARIVLVGVGGFQKRYLFSRGISSLKFRLFASSDRRAQRIRDRGSYDRFRRFSRPRLSHQRSVGPWFGGTGLVQTRHLLRTTTEPEIRPNADHHRRPSHSHHRGMRRSQYAF